MSAQSTSCSGEKQLNCEMLSFKLVIFTTVLGICLAGYPCLLPMKTPDLYVYVPVPFSSNLRLSRFTLITFDVKTCNDAHLVLSASTSTSQLHHNGVKMYEIVIGGWANTQSVIRKAKQGPNLAVSKRHSLLNCHHFRSFYVSWKGGVVKVGELTNGRHNPYQPPFLTYTDPHPFTVHQVFVSGWKNQSSRWRIDNPTCFGK